MGYTNVVTTYGYDLSGPRVVVVGGAKSLGGSVGSITSAVIIGPRIFIDYPSNSTSKLDSERRCLAWSKEKISGLMGSFKTGDVEILEARKESCLLRFSSRITLDAYQFNPN
jgi:hypothetical protein